MKKQSQYADLWSEILNPNIEILKDLKGYVLKKQSQFVPGQNGATSYPKGEYGKIQLCGAKKTKHALSAVEWANFMVHSSSFIVHSKDKEMLFEKTKPIYQPSTGNTKH